MLHPVVTKVIQTPLAKPLDMVRWMGGRSYPDGAILHFDANTDPYTEQTGGPHTFNHAILSPQYQRQADGSSIDVGAKVAADFYGGEKWVRSCGAVANLLPSGAEGFTASWGYNGCSLVGGKVVAAASTSQKYFTSPLYAFTSGVAYTQTLRLKYSGVRYAQLTMGGAAFGSSQYANFDLIDGTVAFSTGCTASIVAIGDSFLCSITATATATASASGVVCAFAPVFNSGRLPVGFVGDGVIGVIPSEPIFTATAYPVPYVPPGVTQPASNATTTNGMWFSLPDGSPMWKALTGEPLTLATRVRMGVGSGDLALNVNTILDAVSCRGAIFGVQFSERTSDNTDYIVRSYDRTGLIQLGSTWPRNAIIRRITQVNTAGTQFRVGYMIEGTHTTIRWSAWANYDGSFDPSTLYRLMLGYNNPYPMWFNKITAWKKQATDAEILEAWT